jgi:hypothetical protein
MKVFSHARIGGCPHLREDALSVSELHRPVAVDLHFFFRNHMFPLLLPYQSEVANLHPSANFAQAVARVIGALQIRRAAYLKMYGNICYDTRASHVNFPWSSERKAR